jgi:hypothetical protein
MIRKCFVMTLAAAGMWLFAQSVANAKYCEGATPNSVGKCPLSWICSAGTCTKDGKFCTCQA